MKKAVSLLLIFILSSIGLCGCFSYKDINKLIFVTAVIVDLNKDNSPIVYIEALKPFRSTSSSSEQGERLVLKGTGKTLYEAMRDIHLSTSFKLNYTQNKVIMFTTKAAHYGIDNWIDIFDRDQEFVIRPYLAITDEDPEDLLKLPSIKDDYLGIFIKRLIDNEGASTRSVRLAINEYLNRRLIGSQTCVITAISIKKDMPEARVEIAGGSVLKDDKLVALLTRAEGQGYNFLMNILKTGSLEISNPERDGSFISLNILRTRTKTDLSYDGKVINLKKTITVKTNIEEINKHLALNNQNLAKIKQKSESNIKEACMRVFEKYKEDNLDIFEVKEALERKYPKVKIDDPLKITELQVIVNENIEGSPDTQDFPD